MWKTKIINVEKEKLTANYTVEFYKDDKLKETFVFRNVSKPESIDRLIYDQLTQYKKMDEIPLNIGFVDLTKFEPTVKEETPPTPEELAMIEYMAKLQEVKKLLIAIDLGIIDNKNTRYLSVLKYLKTNFDPDKHLDILN